MSEATCLVTGGRGFLGRHLVDRLLKSGDWKVVRIVDIQPEIRLDEAETDGALRAALQSGHAEYISADIVKYDKIDSAIEGASVVFHMAAPNPLSENEDIHRAVTVTGTQNVIDACVKHGVKTLIYTSSASVVFDGLHDIKNGDESLPYPDKPLDIYGATKAAAERLVLEASGLNGLKTASLRPSGIFGPGDNLFVPSTVDKAAKGMLKFVIGDGENMMDFTYVENVAHAHICAEKALQSEEEPSGKAYFITNGEPRKFWDFLFGIVVGLGYSRPLFHLPTGLIITVAYIVEFIFKILGRFGLPKPSFTPSVIRISTKWRTFSSARAARLLGYAPPIPLEEGVRKTIASFSHKRKEVLVPAVDRNMSKAHRLLGEGYVACLLLWREVHFTAAVLLGMAAVHYLLFSFGLTLVSLVSNALLYAIVFHLAYIFIQIVVQTLFGFKLPSILFHAEVPDTFFLSVGLVVRSFWNETVVPFVEALFVDREFLIKVAFIVWILKLVIGRLHLSTFVISVILGLFTLPALYERYEKSVDEILSVAGTSARKFHGVVERSVAKYVPKRFQLKAD